MDIMLRKRKLISYLTILFMIFIVSALIPNLNGVNNINEEPSNIPKSSIGLDGAENIVITHIHRVANISDGRLVFIQDRLDIKNLNNNPINSILIGIPLNITQKLVNFKAMGELKNNLYCERKGLISSNSKGHEFEMISVYFSSPLQPYQTKTVRFWQTFIALCNYEVARYAQQEKGIKFNVYYKSYIFPSLPYRAEGALTAEYKLLLSGTHVTISDWASNSSENILTYSKSYLAPFAENLGSEAISKFKFIDKYTLIVEVISLNREISISPWGTLIVKEAFSIINLDYIPLPGFPLFVPLSANNIEIYDDLGQLKGNKIAKQDSIKSVNVSFAKNRVVLDQYDIGNFILKYTLNLRDYLSINWFQQSIKMNIYPTYADFIIREQTTKIIIDGCYSIDSISATPEGIYESQGKTILIYEDIDVVSSDKHPILITYTIDLFDLLLRPIIFMLTITLISAVYIVYVKKKKERGVLPIIKKEMLPQNEIREFCSLYEEKNALVLEIRKAEEDLIRRKLPKKKYRNLVDKNESKIKVIEDEIKPFKKILIEIGETFENIVQKLEVLEAERQTVEDGLKLLESRYKKGKLPSRVAFEKLSGDFLKRRRKIDRTIDRYIQQLRNYLL